MSRFGNLEFNGELEDGGERQATRRDESFYIEEAQSAFEWADFERALRHYSKALEFNPQNATAWAGQVRALIELGEFREAKMWADKALERFPREPELLAAKAVALGRTGELDAALAFSDAAIEERGDTPYIWLARGDVLLAREERRADYCFDKALHLAPQNWFIAWLAARIQYFYRQFGLALKQAQHAVEWNAGRAVVWATLGLCQKEMGMTGAARSSFEQALQLDPKCADGRRGMVELSRTGLGSQIVGWWRRLFQP